MISEKLVQLMKTVGRVSVLTGAGISAESGIPTFRGENGLWKKYRPEELANVDAFIRNPELVWEWYAYRQNIISSVKPNPGHVALAFLERQWPDMWIITQNVDGLHRRAGNRQILELHGNILNSRCMECDKKSETLQFDGQGEIPRCDCGGLMRPDVVWFGEMLPQHVLDRAFQEAEHAELFFSVGTSGLVQPAASLPLIAHRAGAYVVEINVEKTVLSDQIHETILGPSGEVLPRIVEHVWGWSVEDWDENSSESNQSGL